MEPLISKQEVLSLAFADDPAIDVSQVADASILAAERKFIVPVVNGLYDKLAQGLYPEFLNEYIKPALAMYVKYMMITELASNIGSMGIVAWKSPTSTPSDAKQLAALRASVRSKADVLMARAIDRVESDPEGFPEYDSARNVRNRVSISSKVIL